MLRRMIYKNFCASIGFVPQKALLFSGSIEENLRYGKEDASNDELK